jgi:hypothetical protein
LGIAALRILALFGLFRDVDDAYLMFMFRVPFAWGGAGWG